MSLSLAKELVRSLSSSCNGKYQKVFVVLEPSEPSHVAYYIYIVDPNEKGSGSSISRRNPTFRLKHDFPGFMAFAVVDLTLYMFGGSHIDWSKESYSYSLFLSRGPDVSLTDVSTISPMQYTKTVPRAVLISDRICVFSCYLGPQGSDFEMYNPSTREWSSVPDPPIEFPDLPKPKDGCGSVKLCEVKSYCVENLILFISTVMGSYCIDFGQQRNSNDCMWVVFDLPLPRNEYSQSTRPFLKDGTFIFTPCFDVYDLDKQQQQPLLSFLDMKSRALKPRDQSIFLLPKKEGERLRACVFEAGGLEWGDGGSPDDSVFGFYLFKFDDDDDDDDGTKKLSPTLVNSGLFYLDTSIRTYDINIVGVFPW